MLYCCPATRYCCRLEDTTKVSEFANASTQTALILRVVHAADSTDVKSHTLTRSRLYLVRRTCAAAVGLNSPDTDLNVSKFSRPTFAFPLPPWVWPPVPVPFPSSRKSVRFIPASSATLSLKSSTAGLPLSYGSPIGARQMKQLAINTASGTLNGDHNCGSRHCSMYL